METFKFSKEFMLGTASSSTQIEGGDTNNTWYEWCRKKNNSNRDTCIRGCDHWNRVEQDTGILKSLHVQTYRMSLEWSRIEPSAGEYSEEAIQHYRDEILLLQRNGIKPLVTLHHFSDPLWFQKLGGWKDPRNTEFFIKYVKFAVEKLGDLVTDWITFNEPNVYVIFGYLLGVFPPGERNVILTCDIAAQIIKTHTEAYSLIHKIRTDRNFNGETKVGTAIHFRIFDALTSKGKKTAALVDYMFHELYTEGVITGHLMWPLPKKDAKIKKGLYADFLGINYYTRNIVEFALDPSNYFYKFLNDGGLDKSDLGWDIYPEGIYRVCKKYYSKYELPIYITENGIADEKDNRRPKYIADHLAWLFKAVSEGIPVERYYHWSHLDNFEWNEGESARFGLYQCDFDTQKRTARKSAELYARVCKNKGLTQKTIKEFSLK
ncbi:MAG TPA: glycoside hydrolase family 1 protein [Anaerovoracaceae bacterium]|nr:glycoside hydrolase family 1 protein [Anaerovoracaceae bacterium]